MVVRRVFTALSVCGLLLVSGCGLGTPDANSDKPPNLPPPTSAPPPTTPQPSQSQSGGAQVLVTGLSVPWGVAFLPNGNALVTERSTRWVMQVTPAGKATKIAVIDQAVARGEGGLLGIAVSPRYASDKTVFLYYTTATDNRIASWIIGQKPKPLVTGIPAANTDNGGRLAFGPDGYLYVTTGDAGNPQAASVSSGLAGKILRMTAKGKPAPGNPFPNSLVWSYGHRNNQGLAWDSKKRLYAIETGQKADEINLIKPGKNYGWPTIEGPGPNKSLINPLLTWKPSDCTPGGLMISGTTMVVAALQGQKLWLITMDADGSITKKPTEVFAKTYGRLRTVIQAPDGAIWVTTSNRDGQGKPVDDDDRILRITPPGGGGVNKL